MQWRVTANLAELYNAGVDINGLYVVRRVVQDGQRRLVGRVQELNSDRVVLSESLNEDSVCVDDVYLEGNIHSFSRCLKVLLGRDYDVFNDNRFIKEGQYLTGTGLNAVLLKMKNFLSKSDEIRVAEDLSCSGSQQISVSRRDALFYSDVEYCYNASKTKRHKFAWAGLEAHGPYSSCETIGIKTPSFLVVCPEVLDGKADQFIQKLLFGIDSVENSVFSQGFVNLFKFNNPKVSFCYVSNRDILEHGSAKAYDDAISKCLVENSRYSAALVLIHDKDAQRPIAENPYYSSKALLLMNGIPVQQIRENTIRQNDYQFQYSLQNISVALYAKLGGIPWTIDHDQTYHDEIVVGMGNCELSGSRFTSRQRYVGITTVFRGDGNYLLSNVSSECQYDEYPEVLRETMISVLHSVKKRNGWQKNDRIKIVFHATKPLKNVEISEIIKDSIAALGGEQSISFAFLTINHDHCFKLLDSDKKDGYGKAQKGKFVPARGTVMHMGANTRLLSIQAPHLIKKATTPTPRPLLVHWHKDSTYYDIDYLAEQVLKFTSLSWRSVHPTYSPVTITYSELIAEALVKLREVRTRAWSPKELEVNLQASRWFL